MALEFLAGRGVPPWLPRGVGEARRLAFVGQHACFIVSLAFAAGCVAALLTGRVAFGALLAAICALGLGITYLMKSAFFDAMDEGRAKEAAPRLLACAVFSFLVGLVPGIILLFSYVRLDEALHEAHVRSGT